MGRTCIVGEAFVDTFPAFQQDGYTKTPGLSLANGDFVVSFRFNGAPVSPLSFTIDEPGATGEYRIQVPANQLNQVGYWQIEIAIPALTQIWTSAIEAIASFTDVLRSMFMGSQQVEFQVRDANQNPIVDAFVQVFDASGQSLVQAGKTNQSTGNLDTTLDPGNYKVIVSKALTLFQNPYAVTIPTTDGVTVTTVAVSGQPLAVTPPAASSLCRVYGFIQTLSGEYSTDYPVYIKAVGSGDQSYVKGTGAIDQSSMGVASSSKQVFADPATGVWEVDLVQGAKVTLSIPAQNINKQFIVPAAASVNFRDILATPGGSNLGSVVISPSTNPVSSLY